jgi:alanine racemase
MPILKANAYGHGLVPVALYLEGLGADAFGVAVVEEGVLLRQAGVTAPILVLGGVARSQIATYLEHDLVFTASSSEKLRQIEAVAAELGAVARVHLEVDTGMERIGVHWYSVDGFFATALACRHIAIEGLYSHLATADEAERAPTQIQIERFELVRRTYQQMAGALPRWSHLANSGAILQHPQATFDLVRPGLALYGVYPCAHVAPTLALLPALRWTTQVAYFKVVRAGDPVSYGGTWSSPVDTRVITLPVGYGDGYPRRLSNRAEVLVRGRRHPLAGRVCMDMAMVAIGDSSAWNGDEVVLIGEDGADAIRVEDLAEWADTIPWEILTGISTRVPRRYRVAGELVDRRSLRTPSDSK